MAKVTVKMKTNKITKNTVRFEEIVDSEFTAAEIGTIYIPKGTLGKIGYKDGMKIVLTVEAEEYGESDNA